MRKSLAAVIIIVLVLAAGGTYLALHKSSNNSPTSTTPTNTMPHMATPSATSSTATATSTVSIDNFAFSPASITVKKGTTVTWTNKDSTAHTVTESDSQTGPSSGDLATGKSYSFTYNTVGTFKYHCAIHASMTGTVTVTE